jgi:hypothetical protein
VAKQGAKTNDNGTLGSEWSELSRLAVYSVALAPSSNDHVACPFVTPGSPLLRQLASIA